jgi:hypothetical protein
MDSVATIKCYGCHRQLRVDSSVLRRSIRQVHFCSRACNAKYVAEEGVRQVEEGIREAELAGRYRSLHEETGP